MPEISCVFARPLFAIGLAMLHRTLEGTLLCICWQRGNALLTQKYVLTKTAGALVGVGLARVRIVSLEPPPRVIFCCAHVADSNHLINTLTTFDCAGYGRTGD